MIKTKKCKDSGFTIIELLTVLVIVSFAIIALFVGIKFTENQVFKNGRSRKAILLASARLEFHYFYWKKTGEFLDSFNNADDIPIYGGTFQFDSPSYGNNIDINFDTSIDRDYEYQSLGNNYLRTTVTVKGSWKEPSRDNKIQTLNLIEVYYDRLQ